MVDSTSPTCTSMNSRRPQFQSEHQRVHSVTGRNVLTMAIRRQTERSVDPCIQRYGEPMSQKKPMVGLARRGVRYTREHGVKLAAARVLGGLSSALSAPPQQDAGTRRPSITKLSLDTLVRYEDALAVDWTSEPSWGGHAATVTGRPLRTAWIMSPPGESSGGHQNLFRFISFLEQAGHEAKIYLYTASRVPVDIQQIREMVRESDSYTNIQASIEIYDDRDGVTPDVDAIFATGWETAYPVYRDRSTARRMYFVQDFEPRFYSVGSEGALAENTYNFGFEAFTAGGWLARKLSTEYGMVTHPFDFSADLGTYHRSNDTRRNDIFFYARPVTTRRGFELGIMALDQLKRERPDTTIHMAGWDVSDWDIPFEYVNHGILQVSELPALYNECAAALVLSLTNLSLLPLELLACGTIPVVNDAPNNRMVADNPNIAYTPLSPSALARRLVSVVEAEDQIERSRLAAASMKGSGWEHSGAAFVDAFERSMRG